MSFTQYAIARADVDEMTHRLHWLCSLHLGVPGHVEPCKKFVRTMAFFSHFLVYAPNFVELHPSTSEDLLSPDPGFAEVVGEIVRLQRLTLWNARLHALNMLCHSSLRLSSAEISVVCKATEPSINDHPLLALYNSQDTLRVLTLERIAFDTSRSMPCYHNITQPDLSISILPPINHLAEIIFPNLRTLNVSICSGYSHLKAAAREQHRQANVLGRAQHGTYRVLRFYTGLILSLYLFALTCHTPFLQLRDDEDLLRWGMPML